MKILFLDFDGVIRVPVEHDCHEADFCQNRMRMVSDICKATNAKIVVSSDWRSMSDRDGIEKCLAPFLDELLHEDWATPICGKRWNEVERWLMYHPEVSNYAILEDFAQHFEGCPEEMSKRVLLCSNRHGIVPAIAGRAISTLIQSK